MGNCAVLGSGLNGKELLGGGRLVGRVLSWNQRKASPSQGYPDDFYQSGSTS